MYHELKTGMKTKLSSVCLGLLGLAALNPKLGAQSTAFTYQGLLQQDGRFAGGIYDVTFWLYPSISSDTALASNVVRGVRTDTGLFSAPVDFGNALLTGRDGWMSITIATNGSTQFRQLVSRTRITPAPRALFANVAGAVTNGAIRVEQFATPGAPVPGQVLAFNGTSLEWQNGGGGASAWVLNNTNVFYNNGSVGIGTSTPQARLHVRNGDVLAGAPGQEWIFHTRYQANGDFLHITDADNGNFQWQRGLVVHSNGRVGIGVPNPSKTLSIAGDMEIGLNSADYKHLRIGGGNSDGFLYGSFARLADGIHLGYNYYADAAGNNRIIKPDGGTSRLSTGYGYIGLYTGGVGEVPSKGVTVHTEGNVTVDGNMSVASLTIRGGADLAEPFPMKEEMEKGSVVVIDEEHAGRLKLSTRAYDTQVAGIVSGANGVNAGIALHQEGVLDQGQNVALTGRVYVKADASYGAIKPGDLLTTSDTAGHAMRVGDGSRAQGAILGKAMTPLSDGTGLVLVLVTLQ